MKAYYLGWTKPTEAKPVRVPVVFNGSDWVEAPTMKEHAAMAKFFDAEEAREQLPTMQTRFGGVEEICVCPIATASEARQEWEQGKGGRFK